MGIETKQVYTCERCYKVEENPDNFVGWNWLTWDSDGIKMVAFFCPACYDVVKAMIHFRETVMKGVE